MRRKAYSIIALAIMVCCEFVAIVGSRYECHLVVAGTAIFLIVSYVVLVAMGWFIGNRHYRFWPNKSIFTRLMANAISPNWLGAIYLFMFIIHIGWLSDGGLFQSSSDTLGILAMFCFSLIGILMLASFFPEGICMDGHTKKKLFVSGISRFQNRSVELSNSNLIPLVSILQVAWDKYEKCEMLILKSDTITEIPYLFFDRAKELRLNEMNETDYATYGIEKKNDLDDKLSLVIKKVALAEFICSEDDKAVQTKKETWVRDCLKIHFTRPCDYDDLSACFNMLKSSLEMFDNSYEMYFNLTPGTTVISAIMTLMSIDDNRQLYYYKQNPANQRLQRVDKTKVPLENILSQALETMRKS